MTIIVSIVTPIYAIQVADMKISRGIATVTDYSPKMVFVERQMSFSFTGLAEINGENSADWFAKTWHSINAKYFDKACEDIAKIATEVFSKIKYRSKDKRIAFAGSGWIIIGEKPTPICVLIDNCLDKNHIFKNDSENQFKVEFLTLATPNNMLFGFCGQALGINLRKEVMVPIIRFMKRSMNPQVVIDHLVSGVRKIASYYPNTVGRNVLSCYIPIESVMDNDKLLFGSQFLDFKKPSFQYWPDKENKPRIMAPNIVYQRSLVIQNDWKILEDTDENEINLEGVRKNV